MPQQVAARLLTNAAVAALIVATFGYSVRKWRERSLDRRRALVEEKEPHRIEQLDAAIAGLQAHVHAGKLARRPEILAAARKAVAQVGLGGLYAAEVSPGGAQGWRIEVRPRALLGSLEAWLIAHAAIALVSLPIVLAHALYALGGPLTAALLVVYIATNATGVMAGALRWAGRRGAEIDLVGAKLLSIEAALLEAVPGTSRAEALHTQRARLAAAHPTAIARRRLIDACLVAHVPLAAATLGLAILHFAVTTYY